MFSPQTIDSETVPEELPTAPPESPPEYQAAAVYDEIVKHLQDPGVLASVHREVLDLGKILRTYERDFAAISRGLRKVDDVLARAGGHPRVYESQWKVLHDEYTDLIDVSQLTANKVKAKISEFISVVIPTLQSNDSLKAKQMGLAAYITDLPGLDETSVQTEERFGRLAGTVECFREELETALSIHRVGSKSSADVELAREIDEAIREQRHELAKVDGFVRGAKNVLKLGIPRHLLATLGGGLGLLSAVSALLAFTPMVGAGLLAAVAAGTAGYVLTVGLLEHNAQKSAVRQLIQCLVEEKQRLAARTMLYTDPRLAEVSTKLIELDVPAFEDIVARMSIVQHIWQVLAADAEQLMEELNNPATHLGENDTFGQKLRLVKAAFETLHYALDQYTLQKKADA